MENVNVRFGPRPRLKEVKTRLLRAGKQMQRTMNEVCMPKELLQFQHICDPGGAINEVFIECAV